MIAEVIAIGDELTSGQRLDTNSQWLSQALGQLGVRVAFHTTVADDLEANVEVFRQAANRADLVISTGGLGPTADDLTRQAIAAAFDRELVQNDAAMAHIEGLFRLRKRPMPERNRIQAMFPAGSQMVPNPHGSAPGIDLRLSHSPVARIFALPGVPAEMREMWDGTVEPAIHAELGETLRVIRHRRIKCFGVGESDLEQMLPDLIQRGRQPTVGITVSKATITLRITAEADSADRCLAMMEPTVATMHDCLGDLVFGEEDDELQHAVVRQLSERSLSLATVEWGTRGLVSHWLSGLDPPDKIYKGGIVIRNEDFLVADFGISSGLAGGNAGRSLVEAMAGQVRESFDCDLGLAIGPAPPVAPDSPGKIHFGLASADGRRSASTLYAGHPDILLERAAKQALNFVRLSLIRSAGGR